ncbi:MAG: potassium-transporting ATPase subunit [Akkermansiaceae bacterium]|nr:potassium-transporting ATPase subunit [Akkermansiaceae bacterium]
MAKRTAEFILSAKNETTSTFAKVTGDVSKLGGAFGALGKIIGPALGALGVGLSVKGVADMIQHANDLTDSMRDTSQRLGIGIADLQVFQLAAGNAGIETEQLTGLIGKLNKTTGEIKLNQSSKEVVAAFQRIGISVQDVKKSTPADLFAKVIEDLGKIQDPAVRATTAMQIFGKQGATALTLVNDGAEGLQVARDAIEGTGLALSEVDGTNVDAANDALGTLSTLATAAKQKLGADLAPAISYVANMLLDAGKNGHDFGKDISDGLDWAVGAVDRFASGAKVGINSVKLVFHLLESTIQALASVVLGFGADSIDVLGTKIPHSLNDMIQSAASGLTSLKQGFHDAGIAIGNAVTSAMNLAGEKTSAFFNTAIGQINDLIAKSNEFAHTNFSVIPTINWKGADLTPPSKVDPIKIDFQVPTAGEETKAYFRDLSTLYDNASDATMELARDDAEALKEAWGDLVSTDGGDVAQAWDKIKDSATGAAKAIGGGSEDYSGGSGVPAATKKAGKAIKDLGGIAVNTFSLIEEYGQTFTGSLEKSIEEFTKTGKINFRGFAAEILQEIAAITLKAAILGDLLGNSKYGGSGSILGMGGSSTWGQTISGWLSGFSGAPKATIVPESYDGGGFTGFGSRSGGIDGKGGFPAILHPNESVVDHARGQSLSGGNSIVHQTVIIRETMPAGQARAIQAAAVNASVSRIRDINERGGKRRKSVLGR